MEISANIIIQNLAQLKKMYDKSWEIVTGNCDSLLFLGGQEASTLEAISKSLGKETIDVVSQNRTRSHRNNSSSENNSIMGRELMTPDELKVMKPMECVLMVRAFYPFLCHKFDIEKHPNYKYLEDSNREYAYKVDKIETQSMPDNAELHTEQLEPKDRISIPDIEEDKMTAEIDIPEDEIENINVNNNVSIDDEFEPDSTPSEKLFQMDSMEDEELPDDLQVLNLDKPTVITEEDFADFEDDDSSDLF